jgi:hypothetical protein
MRPSIHNESILPNGGPPRYHRPTRSCVHSERKCQYEERRAQHYVYVASERHQAEVPRLHRSKTQRFISLPRSPTSDGIPFIPPTRTLSPNSHSVTSPCLPPPFKPPIPLSCPLLFPRVTHPSYTPSTGARQTTRRTTSARGLMPGTTVGPTNPPPPLLPTENA